MKCIAFGRSGVLTAQGVLAKGKVSPLHGTIPLPQGCVPVLIFAALCRTADLILLAPNGFCYLPRDHALKNEIHSEELQGNVISPDRARNGVREGSLPLLPLSAYQALQEHA